MNKLVGDLVVQLHKNTGFSLAAASSSKPVASTTTNASSEREVAQVAALTFLTLLLQT